MTVGTLVPVRVRTEDGKLVHVQPVVLANADGSASVGTNVFYNDTTTVLAGAATFTGTARDVGVAAGSATSRNTFKAFAKTDQIGTLSIECSNDNITWSTISSAALVVDTPLHLSVPVMTRYHRVKLVNGTTLQTNLIVNSGYVN